MKQFIILMRIAFVGIFWSIFFLEGIRVILLTNWHFDIFRSSHWEYAWKLWLSGWVIDAPKEWAFILIILTFIPLWLSGWAALSMLEWEKFCTLLLKMPLKIFNKIFGNPLEKIAKTASVKVVKKKKSYKEVRPRNLRPVQDGNNISSPAKTNAKKSPPSTPRPLAPAIPTPEPAPTTPQFNHSLFEFDDNNIDFDFDLFDDKPKETEKTEEKLVEEKPVNKPQREKNKQTNKENKSQPTASKGPSNSTLEVIKQKGYEVISGITIKNTLIDFIGLSNTQLCICLNDKEPGDWLADEERFNDEEPLWFSESSHRISPVRKIDLARQILKDKLTEADLNFEITAYVIEQIGNIINAEDMFEIWDGMNINVTRIDRGTPKELKLFAKTLEDAEEKIAPDKFEKMKKLIRNIA